MTFSVPLLWLSDPAWCAMDTMARGFHAQLVLLAARAGGELPTDEAQWRRWLNIPEENLAQLPEQAHAASLKWLEMDVRTRGEQLGQREGWLEQLWQDRWYPMVCQAWSPSRPGFVTCLAAQALAGQVLAAPAPTEEAPAPRTPRRKAKAGPKVSLETLSLEQVLSAQGPIGAGIVFVRPLEDKLCTQEDVVALWHLPVNRAQSLNVWAVGLALLGQNPNDDSNNRSFLASLIRTYGERKVAAAVGELSGRSVPPADPRAFLRAILRRETEGNPAAQRAREQRASIPL